MTRLLLVIASPRAGSTNLERLLQGFDRVETFGEVFHPTGGMPARRSAAFLDFLGVDHGDGSRARAMVRSVVRRDPVAACGDLMRMAASRGAAVAEVKLFAGFLPAPVVEAILRRYRPVCIRLHRTPIDAFISYEKARMVGVWRLVDTTGLRPSIAARDFGFWKWKQQSFYQMAGYLMARNGIAPVDIAYEDFYREGGDTGRLQEDLGRQGIDIGRQGRRDALVRQDLARGRAEKVANWDAFVAEYCRSGSEAELTSWRFDGSRAALWARMQTERVLPRGTMRRLASAAYPLARDAGVLRA